MHFSQFIGVDISKDTLDAAIYPAKDKKMDFLHFDNTTRGLNEMLKWLKSRGIKPSEMVICAEHTGVYTNPLIDFTEKKGLSLSLNSPLDIKHSMGITRGKNDAIDAGRIAEMSFSPCNVEVRSGIIKEFDKTDAVFVEAYLITGIPDTKPDRSNRVVLIYEVSWHSDEEGDKTCYDAVYFEGLKIYPGDTKVVCSFNPETIDRSDAAWGWFIPLSYESQAQCYRENVTAIGGNVTPITVE